MTSDQDGWQRLSPLSPVLRGGILLVAVTGYVISQLIGSLVPWLRTGPSYDGDLELAARFPLAAAGVLALVLAAVAGVAWFSWRFTRFRVSDSHVELRQGWLFRQHRVVPVDRIQAVEVSRPLLAQLFGLAQVNVQSAGGGDSQLKIAFLPLSEATSLRQRLQGLASGHETADAVQAVDPSLPDPTLPDTGGRHQLPGQLLGIGVHEGRAITSVPNLRLLAATVLHSSVILLAVLALGWLAAAVFFGQEGLGVSLLASLPAMAPVLFGIGLYRVRELLTHGNFALSDVGGAVRVVHGLTDHRVTTIPLHRIQAIGMVQPVLWRPFGWWRVRVNVAGIPAGEDGMSQEATVLPVGPLDEALNILLLLDPMLDRATLERATLGEGEQGGWTLVSPRARWLDPWSWRRTGYVVSEHCAFIRRGRFSREVAVVPHARIQSLTLHAGPLQRHLGLAGVHLVSTPGAVKPRVPHLDLAAAQVFLVEQSARSARARAALATGTGAPLPAASAARTVALTPGSAMDWGPDTTRTPAVPTEEEK